MDISLKSKLAQSIGSFAESLNYFDPSTESSWRAATTDPASISQSLTYNFGSVSGYQGYIDLVIGDITATSQSVLVATSVPDILWQDQKPIDGYMGIAPPVANVAPSEKTFVENIYNELKSPVFGVDIRSQDDGVGF